MKRLKGLSAMGVRILALPSRPTRSTCTLRPAMRDVKSDWKRWSAAERVGVVALIASLIIICGSSIAGALTG